MITLGSTPAALPGGAQETSMATHGCEELSHKQMPHPDLPKSTHNKLLDGDRSRGLSGPKGGGGSDMPPPDMTVDHGPHHAHSRRGG